MESQQKTVIESIGQYIRQSVTLKLLTIFILMLLLMIPVAFVLELIRERDNMRQLAINEVSDKWANAQHVYGPVLTLPFNKQVLEDEKVKTVREEAHLLPSLLGINATVEPRLLHRGIYEVAVYDSEVSFTGNFSEMDEYISELGKIELLWNEAFLTIGISDLRGIKEKVLLNWNGQDMKVEPGTHIPWLVQSGITVNNLFDKVRDTGTFQFSFKLHLQGSHHLGFIPMGKETFVELTSDWKDPSFSGSFLPDERTVNEEGFTASYQVLELNRNYPQFWIGQQNAAGVQNSAFGVDLLLPGNDYQKAMRSAKYALLIVSLTFLTFFLVEVFSKQSVHPFQYILVGLALVLFYVLLISLSEHISFHFAYLIAGLAVLAMTGLYAMSILRKSSQSVILATVLSLSYMFVYVILQIQDYALLVGSVGLTAVLAFTMYITRKINWYNLSSLNKAGSAEE